MSETEPDEEQEEEEEQAEFQPSFEDNIIKLHHSFGYDCKRLFNLVLIDDDTLIFASGNLIHYFSISKLTVTFRETVHGAGVGFITKNCHPDHEGLLTIAENGPNPTIFIYEYPSHNIRITLDKAAKRQFTCGSYNSTGELFASQAGYPDFMLTIWRWQKAEVVLRSKSFQSDVLHVHFSNFNPILLASCGLTHIKFWKMANTFTGLKLKGDLGRFGKTDFSDIYAIYMLPDENVVSGCEWGNMLLWEAGLIKFEICRKGRKPCHLKPITRITMDDGEVMTVGMDGYVRIWFWETVDLADPPDDDRFVEIEPIYEFRVGDCEIRCMQKIKAFEDKDFGYYAQDGNGGIWYCDLNTYDQPNEPRKLYTCHGGKVITAQTSPTSPHLMTLGEDGKIFVFDYAAKTLLLEKQFISVGTDLIWFNLHISPSGRELVASFEDGIIRHLVLNVVDRELVLVRAIKGHVATVTKLAVNPKNTVLVTGSADKTIFIFNITEHVDGLINIQPMGFISVNGIPNFFNWNQNEDAVILIGCKSGEVFECLLPDSVTEKQTFLSYDLTDSKHIKSTTFVSVKSRIRRDINRALIKKRKEKKRQRKLAEVEKLKAANPGLQIDMETALADSEPDEEEEPLHIPAKPNSVLWIRYTDRDTLWASMGGYDAGYIYELAFGALEPVRCTIVTDGDDCEMHSYLVIEDFLIFGLVNGNLRINHINPEDFTDLHDYRLFSMHDTFKGIIPKMLRSHNGRHIFSVGHDGNIFVYTWNGPNSLLRKRESVKIVPLLALNLELVEDIDEPEYPSLEQEKIYAEIKRQEEAAAAHDRKVLAQIAELQIEFNDIVRENSNLHEDFQIPDHDMLLDPRILKQIGDEMQAELDDVRDDLAYDLEAAQVGKTKLYNFFLKPLDHLVIKMHGIGTDMTVSSFRLQALGEEYEKVRNDIEERLRQEALKRGEVEPISSEEKEDSIQSPGVERFFFGRDPSTILPRFSKKMLRLLTRYRSRQLYEIERIYNWGKLHKEKPDPNKNHPDDDENIKEAERSLGDHKLKIGQNYQPRVTDTLTFKYIEMAECYEQIHNICDAFNKQLFLMRKRKYELYELFEEKRRRIEVINTLVPVENRVEFPATTPINMDEEYPELNLTEHVQPGCGIEIADILDLKKTVADLLPKPPQPLPKKGLSQHELQEIQLYRSLKIYIVPHLPSIPELMDMIEKHPPLNDPSFYETGENGEPSPFLTNTRYHFLLNLIDEQQGILLEVNECITKYDEALEKLRLKRFQTKFDENFMLCHMITLHQELNILRDSEEIENQLLSNADEAMRTRNQMQGIINSSNRQIDDCRKTVDRVTEQIASLQLKFNSTTKGHKFYDFLRRIFKKKWRPPKIAKGPDESSESSSDDDSSSEDEEDTKSIDSSDMTTIRLDETHCPAGLDRNMYDLAFKLRSERHSMERMLIGQQKVIEQRRGEVNELQKQMKFHEDVYAHEKETLLIFRRKRQQELNKVKTCVVVRTDQVQHFYDYKNYEDLSRAVLFDSTRLGVLKGRVAQLNDDTVQTKRLYRINIVHLRRMNTDIKFMRFEITRLEDEIKQAMMKKFGMTLNLDDLEEAVLRKYVFELETTAEQELQLIEAEIRRKKLELARCQEELISETKLSTEKLNILTVLQEEKNCLDQILVSQDKNYLKWMAPQKLNFDQDIEKLAVIEREQIQQIKCLERDICTLRMKSKPLQLYSEVIMEEMAGMQYAPADAVAADAVGSDQDEAAGVCPEMLDSDAYKLRSEPDQFIMDRTNKVVQKYFVKCFAPHMSAADIRKYANNATRYLGPAAHSVDGKVTDNILKCVSEALQTILPKKYMIHLNSETLSKLFNEIMIICDYERSEVNTEDVISGIFTNAMETLYEAEGSLNKTQHIMVKMFQELIEVLPLEEFQSEKTLRIIADILSKEAIIDPKCINIEGLVDNITKYARDNLLDGITAIPIRHLAENIFRDLMQRKPGLQSAKCGVTSVPWISISKKK